MPYIDSSAKTRLSSDNFLNSGELNYVLTTIIIDYITHRGLRYETINDVVGALENTKQEFLRRIVGPYENKKMKENGDVYEALCQLIK